MEFEHFYVLIHAQRWIQELFFPENPIIYSKNARKTPFYKEYPPPPPSTLQILH